MPSYLPSLTRDNVSVYTVPAAFVVALLPKLFSNNAYRRATGKKMNSQNPRRFVQDVEEDQALDSKTKGRILRAEAAQSNGFETLGVFAAAVVAGNAAGLSPGRLNGLSIGYVFTRFVYNHIYIFQDVVPSIARSASWMTSIGLLFAMFIQAGQKWNEKAVL
jgi:uncharacterized MAPEG superfamily protein